MSRRGLSLSIANHPLKGNKRYKAIAAWLGRHVVEGSAGAQTAEMRPHHLNLMLMPKRHRDHLPCRPRANRDDAPKGNVAS